MPLTKTLLLAAASTLAAAGMALAGGAAANAATPTASPSASASTSAAAKTGVPLRAISAHAVRAQFGTVPSALRTDLKALHGDSRSARKAAAAAIETKALDGAYGSDVKTAAEDAKTAWASAPASLKSALKAVRSAPKADRRKDLAAVATKAIDGDYGTAIETYAKTVRTNVERQQAADLPTAVGSIV